MLHIIINKVIIHEICIYSWTPIYNECTKIKKWYLKDILLSIE